jgi:hypothetical protein
MGRSSSRGATIRESPRRLEGSLRCSVFKAFKVKGFNKSSKTCFVILRLADERAFLIITSG